MGRVKFIKLFKVESFEEKKNIFIRDDENVESNNSQRNNGNGMKRLNLDLNDDPTDFNVDIFLSLKGESSFLNNGSTVPVILSPIVNFLFIFSSGIKLEFKISRLWIDILP